MNGGFKKASRAEKSHALEAEARRFGSFAESSTASANAEAKLRLHRSDTEAVIPSEAEESKKKPVAKKPKAASKVKAKVDKKEGDK